MTYTHISKREGDIILIAAAAAEHEGWKKLKKLQLKEEDASLKRT